MGRRDTDWGPDWGIEPDIDEDDEEEFDTAPDGVSRVARQRFRAAANAVKGLAVTKNAVFSGFDADAKPVTEGSTGIPAARQGTDFDEPPASAAGPSMKSSEPATNGPTGIPAARRGTDWDDHPAFAAGLGMGNSRPLAADSTESTQPHTGTKRIRGRSENKTKRRPEDEGMAAAQRPARQTTALHLYAQASPGDAIGADAERTASDQGSMAQRAGSGARPMRTPSGPIGFEPASPIPFNSPMRTPSGPIGFDDVGFDEVGSPESPAPRQTYAIATAFKTSPSDEAAQTVALWKRLEMSLKDAERYVRARPPGAFVIRKSSDGGNWAITISMQLESGNLGALHDRIELTQTPHGTAYGVASDRHPKFDSPTQLVAYFMKNKIKTECPVLVLPSVSQAPYMQLQLGSKPDAEKVLAGRPAGSFVIRSGSNGSTWAIAVAKAGGKGFFHEALNVVNKAKGTVSFCFPQTKHQKFSTIEELVERHRNFIISPDCPLLLVPDISTPQSSTSQPAGRTDSGESGFGKASKNRFKAAATVVTVTGGLTSALLQRQGFGGFGGGGDAGDDGDDVDDVGFASKNPFKAAATVVTVTGGLNSALLQRQGFGGFGGGDDGDAVDGVGAISPVEVGGAGYTGIRSLVQTPGADPRALDDTDPGPSYMQLQIKSRGEAEAALKGKPAGAFVIRSSSQNKSTYPCYAISVAQSASVGGCFHEVINRRDQNQTDCFFLKGGTKFQTIEKLIGYYSGYRMHRDCPPLVVQSAMGGGDNGTKRVRGRAENRTKRRPEDGMATRHRNAPNYDGGLPMSPAIQVVRCRDGTPATSPQAHTRPESMHDADAEC